MVYRFAKFRLGQHHLLLILKQPDKQVMQFHYKELQEKEHLYLLEQNFVYLQNFAQENGSFP